jgi:hypothetical protein
VQTKEDGKVLNYSVPTEIITEKKLGIVDYKYKVGATLFTHLILRKRII